MRGETEVRPKPMVPIGERPILWHIMHVYARRGFKRFILCLANYHQATRLQDTC